MERFDALLAGHFEGTLTASEQEELVSLVRFDPASRRRFVALAELDGLLWGHFAPQRVRGELLSRTVNCLPDVQRQEQTVEDVMARIAAVGRVANSPYVTLSPVGRGQGDGRVGNSPYAIEKGAWRILGDTRLWVSAAAVFFLLAAALYQVFGRGLIELGRRDLAALVFVATLERQTGQVAILTEYMDMKVPARTGQPLSGKNGVEITGSGRAVVAYADRTTLDLVSTYRRACLWLCRPATHQTAAKTSPFGKRVTLESGILDATVSRQADDQPLTLTTPQAALLVLGTRFRLVASANFTRLDVYEGQVKLTRLADQNSVVIGAREFGIVRTGVELKAFPGAAQPPPL